MSALADAGARERALHPARSCIVQAPAGSGKTGLLIQRYLALLATVDRPEEIVAITFTRKATGEMRERVLDALDSARVQPVPDEAHARTTWSLARAALDRDAELGWGIAAQPGRLRILTIDALCGWIARHLVLRSGIPGAGALSDDAAALHAEAATLTLELLEEPGSWSDAIAILLEHLDNDAARLRSMLVHMLASRDQWLRFLGGGEIAAADWREALDGALERLCADRLAALRAALPECLAGELVAVCGFAGERLATADPEHVGAACAGLRALPDTRPECLGMWRGVGEILLTKEGRWRRQFNVKTGFPPGDSTGAEMKRRARDLCAGLAEAPGAEAALAQVARLPEPGYTDAQWSVLEALLEVLRIAAATLKVVFAERLELDHAEVAGAARLALGADEAPSDLALALDGRISHLLVDEFQDTSHGQYELLARLTAGWSVGDGRTLFLVGDPMQSIYRFREADVGLFQHARVNGVGDVPLESLVLGSNFRSRPEVVEWVNGVFPAVLGARDDPTTGAVAYRASEPVREPGHRAGVELHALGDEDPGGEAAVVAALVADVLAETPGASIAILVRARTHLGELLPALGAAGIAYRGVEVEPLADVPVVRDLLALTTAALDPLDRVAWLALLRAPWCGLALADLHALVAQDDGSPVLDLLADARCVARLSTDGAARLARVRPALAALAAGARRGRLARRVEAAWQNLGGPACIDAAARAPAERFLALLHDLGDGALARGSSALREQVAKLYAEPATTPGSVEIMTMHKAKGLEFDTVILPGLARSPAGDDRALLEWTSRAAGRDAADLLLAPIPAVGAQEQVPLYEFVRALEREKGGHETARLLYVAATRARERLHLVATLRRDEHGAFVGPVSKSLLGLLWPVLGNAVDATAVAVAPIQGAIRGDTGERDPRPRRLARDWTAPAPPAPAAGAGPVPVPGDAEPGEPVEFDWAGRLARHVGTVVHAVLGDMAAEGLGAWNHGRLRACRPGWGAELRTLGVAGEDLDEGVGRVEEVLARALGDARAGWLLDPGHAEAASELALAGAVGGIVVRGVVDRTFLDADGVRWVVDYKTGRHEGADIERFLDREQERYRGQLERYAQLVGALWPGPIRLALYYPVSGGWREWPAQEGP